MGFILLGAFIVCTLECCSHRSDSGKDFDILDDFKFSERKQEEADAAGADGKEAEGYEKRNTTEMNFGQFNDTDGDLLGGNYRSFSHHKRDHPGHASMSTMGGQPSLAFF
jgi:hypothetical protein